MTTAIGLRGAAAQEPASSAATPPVAPSDVLPTIDLGLELRDTKDGLIVGNVDPGSLGASTGFRGGDLVQSVGETAVVDRRSFEAALRQHTANEKVAVRVVRENTISDLMLAIPANLLAAAAATSTALSAEGQAANAASGEASIDVRGVSPQGSLVGVELPFVDLGWGLQNTRNGTLIVEVRKGPLHTEELMAGDVIVSIGKNKVGSPAAVNYELHRHRAGAIVEFELLREDRRVVKRVRLPKSHQALLVDAPPADALIGARSQADLTPEEVAAVRALVDEVQALRAEIAELRKLRDAERATANAGDQAGPSPD
jgi:S1-C subfamily serine protease